MSSKRPASKGLVNALHRFDPEKGNRFSTYANYWIMKLVNQAIRQQAGLSESEMELRPHPAEVVAQ